MTEPSRCKKCGNQAKIRPTFIRDKWFGTHRGIAGWYVTCTNPVLCSQGREMKSQSGAVRVWNKENA